MCWIRLQVGPAAGLTVELWTVDEEPRRLRTVTTNADGRTGAPLLEGGTFTAGATSFASGPATTCASATGSTTTPSSSM